MTRAVELMGESSYVLFAVGQEYLNPKNINRKIKGAF